MPRDTELCGAVRPRHCLHSWRVCWKRGRSCAEEAVLESWAVCGFVLLVMAWVGSAGTVAIDITFILVSSHSACIPCIHAAARVWSTRRVLDRVCAQRRCRELHRCDCGMQVGWFNWGALLRGFYRPTPVAHAPWALLLWRCTSSIRVWHRCAATRACTCAREQGVLSKAGV